MIANVRIAMRSLRRSPIYSLTSLLTLALGIALVTAAFALVDAVLIRPLPFARAQQLVVLGQRDNRGAVGGVSYPNFQDWQHGDTAGALASMAYARGRGVALRMPDGPHSVLVAFVSPGFLSTLQSTLQLGRRFTPDEERRGAQVTVLSFETWRDLFASDAAILGRQVTLGDGSYTVIGVTARAATYPEWAGIYLPMEGIAATERVLSARDFSADSRVVARLKPGATAVRAAIELNAIASRLSQAYPEDKNWPAVDVASLRDQILGNVASRLSVLSIAMALVLLIGWVNVTNLALVRATTRARELAIRASLGASRSRVVGQLALEQVLLSLAAGIVGALVATLVLGLIRGFAAGTPGAEDVGIGARAILFATLVAIASAVAVGGLPALRIARADLLEALKESTSGAGTGRRQQRVRSALVVGEIALALMLVISAGLLTRSFWRLSHVDPGFDTHHLVAIDLSPPGARYAEPAQTALFYTQLLDAVRGLPGVDRAALTNHMPLNGASLPTHVDIAGRASDVRDPQVLFRTLSPEYLGTVGIPLRRGRNFNAADLAAGTAVMVNETFARTFWPGVDPIGHQLMLHKSAQGFADLGEPLPGVVVGVIGDVHHYGVQSPPVPEVYIPYTRNPWSHMVIVARARGEPAALIPSIRRAILAVDPATVVTGGVFGGFEVIDNIRDGGVSGERFSAMLLASFASCALLLSAIGIYGLMAFAVSQRTREIGIRLALGAHASDVLRQVLRSGAQLVAAGVVVGLVGAFALTRLVASMLFGIGATDAATFSVTTVVLVVVAGIACYLPARRASRVEPADVLRY